MRRLLLLLILCSLPCWAQDAEKTEDLAFFRSAVVSIGEGEDQRALEQLLRVRKPSFGVFYNLGLAYRNLGDIPRSRAAFEQALVASPRSLSTRRRLREIRSRFDSEKLRLDTRWTPWWGQAEAEVLLFLPALILLGAGVLRLSGRPSKPPLIIGLTVSGVILSALLWLTSPPPDRAVVVEESARLLPAPESGKKGAELPAGILVEVLHSQDHYAKIRLGDEREGWVRLAMLERLHSNP